VTARLHRKPEYRNTIYMTVKQNRNTKSVGRPPIGKRAAPVKPLRMSAEQEKAVTDWAKRQPDKPNWSEAVRRLVDIALKASK